MQFATDIAAYTCICCPLGCRIEVALDENGQVSEVSGYTCKRGADYAAQEAVAPERMVTAVLCVSGCLEPVSVKTPHPVPIITANTVCAPAAAPSTASETARQLASFASRTSRCNRALKSLSNG